jgi:hypothetical protein
MKTLYQLAVVVILLGGLTAAASAEIIFNLDFDWVSAPGGFGTGSYVSTPPPTTSSNAVVSSGGNPNGAWQTTMTTATWSDYYAGQVRMMTVTGNTDPNPSDYTLSFDAYGSQAGNIQLGLQSWQNNYFGGSQIINTTLNDTLAAANTWQNFSVNLGTIVGAIPTGATWQFNFQLNSWQWGGPGKTDTLTIDNVVLQTVPEPSTFVLAGLGLAGLWFFRRK